MTGDLYTQAARIWLGIPDEATERAMNAKAGVRYWATSKRIKAIVDLAYTAGGDAQRQYLGVEDRIDHPEPGDAAPSLPDGVDGYAVSAYCIRIGCDDPGAHPKHGAS